MSAPEAAVVRSLKKHLLAEGLHGTPVSRVLVDADPSYAHSRYARDLEPMARVSIGAARPDMLCALERAAGQVVAGFEVKAKEGDWARGLGQARSYRAGVRALHVRPVGRAGPWSGRCGLQPEHRVQAEAESVARGSDLDEGASVGREHGCGVFARAGRMVARGGHARGWLMREGRLDSRGIVSEDR